MSTDAARFRLHGTGIHTYQQIWSIRSFRCPMAQPQIVEDISAPHTEQFVQESGTIGRSWKEGDRAGFTSDRESGQRPSSRRECALKRAELGLLGCQHVAKSVDVAYGAKNECAFAESSVRPGCLRLFGRARVIDAREKVGLGGLGVSLR